MDLCLDVRYLVSGLLVLHCIDFDLTSFSSAHQRAYIFQRRPRTPPKYPKQEEYLKELTKQVCSPQHQVHYCRFEFCVHALSILAHGVHQYEFQ